MSANYSSNNFNSIASQSLLTPRSCKLSKIIQIFENELYWVSSKDIPNKNTDSIFIFSDQSHRYQNFNYDFGPVHLGEVYRFINKLETALRICAKSRTKVCVFTSTNPQKQANSVFLICSFLIIAKRQSPEQAISYFSEIVPKLPPFRDSTADPHSPYKCYMIECLKGLEFAYRYKWFDFTTFNVKEYEYISMKGNGDYNEIVPGKMIAFSGPLHQRPRGSYGQVYTPEDYVPLFKQLGVSLVVRLNDKCYNENIFKQNGIDHIDLIFDDGSTPPQSIVDRFLEASENTKGVVAVHCKSGLGRTGTLIGMYAMKHFRIPAKDFIGWMRIARPGSIHGPQHEYLVDKQEEMFNALGGYNNNISTVKKNYGRTKATPIKEDYQQTVKNQYQREENQNQAIYTTPFSVDQQQQECVKPQSRYENVLQPSNNQLKHTPVKGNREVNYHTYTPHNLLSNKGDNNDLIDSPPSPPKDYTIYNKKEYNNKYTYSDHKRQYSWNPTAQYNSSKIHQQYGSIKIQP